MNEPRGNLNIRSRKDSQAVINVAMGFIIALSILILGGYAYKYYQGLYINPINLAEVVFLLIFAIIVLVFSNNKPKNRYKQNGIRVMGKIIEYEKYSCSEGRHTTQARSQFTDYANSGYGRQAYRVYVKVTNPHTGEETTCVSNGYLHPIEGHNLTEIPVYFHKKNPKAYYVDVKEAIEENEK